MLKFVSTAQMREIDRVSIEEFGIPETILMENAGLESLYYLDECLGGLHGKRIAVFCGKGNNGGDGFVLARHLHIMGVDCVAYLLASKDDLKGDAKLNQEIFSKIGGRIKELKSDSDIKKHKIPILHADAYVDALLGTGITAPLDGIYKTVVEKMNEWKRFCLALDIPTGLSSDGGAKMGLHVKADATIAYGFPKTGMAFYPAAASVGDLKVVNISFPQKVLDESDFDAWLIDGDYVKGKLPHRPPDAHKGQFGHAVVAGGATGMGGAIGMASLAALKVGAGLVTAAVPKVLSQKFELGIPEVVSYHLGDSLGNPENAEAISGFCRNKSVLLVGPGMGRGSNLTELVARIVELVTVPLVIDADGLNNLAPRKEVIKKANVPVVVTPHPGEMSRLTGKSTEEINADRLGAAKEFSREHGCVTVLKGARTVIATPQGTAYVNPSGNPNLASGGTGDVLSGMITGFISQGLTPVDAAVTAVYLHGLAADVYTEKENAYSLSATDLLEYVPKAITALLK